MPVFDYATAPHPVRDDIRAAHAAFWERLAGPGSWWSGAQRLALAEEARRTWPLRREPPWLRALPEPEDGVVPAIAREAVRAIALDAHGIDRDACLRWCRALGDAATVELVAIAVQTIAVDAFAEALGCESEPFPSARGGEPDRRRPGGLGDIGAHVDCLLDYTGPNVGRALSLAPDDNATFFGLVGSMYAVRDFLELVWKDRPLARPQVELVAARVSAINECFY